MIREMISAREIIELYQLSPNAAKGLIRLIKAKLASDGLIFYQNPRLGKVPHYCVRQYLGLDVLHDEFSSSNGLLN